MTYRFVATAAFVRDYDSVLAYLVYEAHSPKAAVRLIDEMDHSIEKISRNPLLNAISAKPTLAALEYREELVGNYVLLYRIEEEGLVVAKRLFHMSQDYERYI